MNVDFTQPMTFYELIGIVLSIIAIVAPLLKAAWRKWLIKPILHFHPTGRATLYCNTSGSYINAEGIFEALHKPITVEKMAVVLERKQDGRQLNLQWSTFISPISQNLAGNFASSVETAHPFRIEADSIMCAFTEYADFYDAARRSIEPAIKKYSQVWENMRQTAGNVTEALTFIQNTEEYASARTELLKALYWEIGQYSLQLIVAHGRVQSTYTYCFNVTENEREKLQANIQEVLNSIVFRSYGMQPHFQAVQVEIRKTEK